MPNKPRKVIAIPVSIHLRGPSLSVRIPEINDIKTLLAEIDLILKETGVMYTVTTKSKQNVNAFTYGLLAHEYLHALGHMSEGEVRRLVHRVACECFGENHIVTELAEKSPWALLNGAPVDGLAAPKRPMEIVKDFDKPNQSYII